MTDKLLEKKIKENRALLYSLIDERNARKEKNIFRKQSARRSEKNILGMKVSNMLAEGKNQREAASIMGVSACRISQLNAEDKRRTTWFSPKTFVSDIGMDYIPQIYKWLKAVEGNHK